MYALLKILHSAPGGERCNISKMFYLLFILLNCLAISTNTSFTLTKLNLETGKKKGEEGCIIKRFIMEHITNKLS